MICPSCRQDVPENKAFCPYCGAALPPIPETDAPAAEGETSDEDRAPETPPWMPPTEVPPPEATSAPVGVRPSEGEPDEPEGAEAENGDLPEADSDEPGEGDEERPDQGSLERALGGTGVARSGVARGAFGGTVAFLVMALLAGAIAAAAVSLAGADVGETARIAGLVFLGFHHVGIQADFPTFEPGQLPGLGEGGGISDLPIGSFDVSYSVAVALMLGTLLALFLLYRAGRRAAEEGGGSLGWRVVQGASVALPYAALSVVVAAVVSYSLRLGPEVARFFGPDGRVELAPSLASAASWTLGLATLAGGLGGLISGAPDVRSSAAGRGIAVVVGGGRMMVGLLLAGLLGVLVLAALSPDMTAAYMEEVTADRSGLLLLLSTVLLLPNLVLWGLGVGMGGSIAAGDYLGSQVHLASLFRFPEGLDPTALAGGLGPGGVQELPARFGIAPVGYFVFIPLAIFGLAVAARRTAQRADVITATEGARVGALSGLVFAGWFVLAIVLAGIGFRISIAFGGDAQGQLGRLGPTLISGALVGIAWGVVIGALGGAMGVGGAAPGRGPRERAHDEEEVEGEAAEEPETMEFPEEERETEELELERELAPAARSPLAPPPAVEVGTGPTGFEGLAAEQRSIVSGEEVSTESSTTIWTEPEAAPEGPPAPEALTPEGPPTPEQAPTLEPPGRPEPGPSAEEEIPEPQEPAREDDDSSGEAFQAAMEAADRDVPEWFPEALRPEADDIDEGDLESRWDETGDEDDEEGGGEGGSRGP